MNQFYAGDQGLVVRRTTTGFDYVESGPRTPPPFIMNLIFIIKNYFIFLITLHMLASDPVSLVISTQHC